MQLYAAWLFVSFIAVVIVFQVALAFGAPWGEAAMGGRYPGTLPRAMRGAALMQAAVLLLMAFIVLSRAGLAMPQWRATAPLAIWIIVAYFAVAVVMNILTPSKLERRIWVPVSMVLLLSSLLVALS